MKWDLEMQWDVPESCYMLWSGSEVGNPLEGPSLLLSRSFCSVLSGRLGMDLKNLMGMTYNVRIQIKVSNA